jgi:rod shape-determining protein MreC
METSRDDFIIAIRSAFLQKGAAQRFSLLVLIIISVILLSLDFYKAKPLNIFRSISKDIIYRGSFIISLPFKSLDRGYKTVKTHFTFYDDYQNLKNELYILKAQQSEIEFLKMQNKELKIVISDVLHTNIKNVIAKVILDKQSPFLKSIILNKGTNSNLKKGMAVLHKKNMVGRIVEVNYLSSRVLLINDLNSKIPVKIQPSGENAIMSGEGNNLASLDFLPKLSTIEEENIVFTSGSDGVFDDGIPIGKITEIEEKFYVEFFSDLNQINFVTVINNKKEDN